MLIFLSGLRLKYTNRSGESLAYSDEGYIDLTHVKNLSLIPSIVSYPEEVRVQAQRCFQGVVEPRVLRIVYGSTLADNKILTFLCPPKVATAWLETLRILTQLIKTEDPRMVWLKNQYLFLYYQDDLCMGPLAADAIKVRKYKSIFSRENRNSKLFLFVFYLFYFSGHKTDLCTFLAKCSFSVVEEIKRKLSHCV